MFVRSYPEQKPKAFLHVAVDEQADWNKDRQSWTSAASEMLNPEWLMCRAGGKRWRMVERGRRDYREEERERARFPPRLNQHGAGWYSLPSSGWWC